VTTPAITQPTVQPQPDFEAFLWSQIKTLPGVQSFTYAVVHDWIGWLLAYSVQVDARADSKQAAWATAEQARQIILKLPSAAWPQGVVSFVQPVEGPFWLPDPNGAPRYCARYQIRVHPSHAVP
jgi:hypothetical protein